MRDLRFSGDPRRKLIPMFAFSALMIGVMPWIHPKNTCNEWLTKWGQLSSDPLWLPNHQFASAGFLVAAGAALFLPLLGKRSFAEIAGSALLAVGSLFEGGIVLIHASASASLGRAFIAAHSADVKEAVRAAAVAMESYDETGHAVASALLSVGCCMIVLAFVQERVVTRLMGVFLAGLGAVWAAQRYHVFNLFHFSIPETAHWDSLAFWFASIAIILYYHDATKTAGAKEEAAPKPEDPVHPMIGAVSES